MNPKPYSYPIPHSRFLENLIRWVSEEYSYYSFTLGNKHPYPHGTFPNQIIAGQQELPINKLWKSKGIQMGGIISYDFKNQLEKLQSTNPHCVNVPDLLFFEAELEITWDQGHIFSNIPIPENIWGQKSIPTSSIQVEFSPNTTREDYIHAFQQVQKQIIEGNTYEMNYCISFEGKIQNFDPIQAFFRLMDLSPMPFSALFKAKNKYLISASPERFLKKTGNKLVAQPIKGTARRGKDLAEDDQNKVELLNSEKEQAENLMITDLMRNDLSKVSLTGSVKVPELFGIYSFPKVHQMISTVESQLKPETTIKDIIYATFPMGSMTGAPKIKTMELIDHLENFKRGWFSGTLLLIDENGDFDSSVIIRSIIADIQSNKLYFGVGSAITIDAEANAEYEECQLKASAIMEVLSGK